MPRCGIVILAAGASSRMGEPKQSLLYGGSTLLERAFATAMGSVCQPIVVVLGAGAEALQPALRSLPIGVVINQNWERGMGTSIRCGIASMQASAVDAAMIFLCDQPLIRSEDLNRMVEAHFAIGKLITAGFYAGSHGTPAIFSALLFDELAGLQDAMGGKSIFNKHLSDLHSVHLPEGEVDIDTPMDFQKLTENESQ